jgi:hypothetical protein
MDRLSFGKVDADDLSLDLGTHQHCVVGDDGANTGQIDRYVVLGDRPGNDRGCRRCRLRLGGIPRWPSVSEGDSAAGGDDDQRD